MLARRANRIEETNLAQRVAEIFAKSEKKEHSVIFEDLISNFLLPYFIKRLGRQELEKAKEKGLNASSIICLDYAKKLANLEDRAFSGNIEGIAGLVAEKLENIRFPGRLFQKIAEINEKSFAIANAADKIAATAYLGLISRQFYGLAMRCKTTEGLAAVLFCSRIYERVISGEKELALSGRTLPEKALAKLLRLYSREKPLQSLDENTRALRDAKRGLVSARESLEHKLKAISSYNERPGENSRESLTESIKRDIGKLYDAYGIAASAERSYRSIQAYREYRGVIREAVDLAEDVKESSMSEIRRAYEAIKRAVEECYRKSRNLPFLSKRIRFTERKLENLKLFIQCYRNICMAERSYGNPIGFGNEPEKDAFAELLRIVEMEYETLNNTREAIIKLGKDRENILHYKTRIDEAIMAKSSHGALPRTISNIKSIYLELDRLEQKYLQTTPYSLAQREYDANLGSIRRLKKAARGFLERTEEDIKRELRGLEKRLIKYSRPSIFSLGAAIAGKSDEIDIIKEKIGSYKKGLIALQKAYCSI